MMKKEHLMWLGFGAVLGVVFAPQIRKLPLLNKLPTV
jgi:hypothetical protein